MTPAVNLLQKENLKSFKIVMIIMSINVLYQAFSNSLHTLKLVIQHSSSHTPSKLVPTPM